MTPQEYLESIQHSSNIVWKNILILVSQKDYWTPQEQFEFASLNLAIAKWNLNSSSHIERQQIFLQDVLTYLYHFFREESELLTHENIIPVQKNIECLYNLSRSLDQRTSPLAAIQEVLQAVITQLDEQ